MLAAQQSVIRTGGVGQARGRLDRPRWWYDRSFCGGQIERMGPFCARPESRVPLIPENKSERGTRRSHRRLHLLIQEMNPSLARDCPSADATGSSLTRGYGFRAFVGLKSLLISCIKKGAKSTIFVKGAVLGPVMCITGNNGTGEEKGRRRKMPAQFRLAQPEAEKKGARPKV